MRNTHLTGVTITIPFKDLIDDARRAAEGMFPEMELDIEEVEDDDNGIHFHFVEREYNPSNDSDSEAGLPVVLGEENPIQLDSGMDSTTGG